VKKFPCALLLVAWVLFFPKSAQAQRCPSNSACVDADTLWPAPGPRQLAFVSEAEVSAPEAVSVQLFNSLAARPVSTQASIPGAPSLSPTPAVESLWVATVLGGISLNDRLGLGLALPFTLYQSGPGLSQIGGNALSTQGLRDPRVTVSWAYFRRARVDPSVLMERSVSRCAAMFRLTSSIPIGDRTSFAGDRGMVLAPEHLLDFRFSRVYVGWNVGLRLRPAPVDLLGTRIGQQVTSSLGVSVDILPEERLSVGVEARTLVGLSVQREVRFDGKRYSGVQRSDPVHLPVEWMGSFRSSPLRGGDFSVLLGIGTSIPITGSNVTAPAWRGVLELAYVPRGRDSDRDGVEDYYDACKYESANTLDGCKKPRPR
jgi:hypothetical protein